MKNNGKKILLPADALAQLQNERHQAIDLHLGEVAKHCSIENQDLDLVLRALLDKEGVPAVDDELARNDVMNRAYLMSKRITAHKLRRLNEAVKEVVEAHNVTDLPPHITWSARRAGVELLPPPEGITEQ